MLNAISVLALLLTAAAEPPQVPTHADAGAIQSTSGREVRALTREELGEHDDAAGVSWMQSDAGRQEYRSRRGAWRADDPQLNQARHPSSQGLPVLRPALEPNGPNAWLVRLDVAQDLEAWKVEALPDITSQTQLIELPVPPDFEHWTDYRIVASINFLGVEDLYWGENLTQAPYPGDFRGLSYTIPALVLHSPIPWHWDGGTVGNPLMFVSVGFTWNLGPIGAFDGVFQPGTPSMVWSGPSGELDGFVNNSNPGISTTLEHYTLLRDFAGRDTVQVYYSPLHSLIPSGDWPIDGPRCNEDGTPTFRGEPLPGGGGHASLWPLGGDFDFTSVSYRITYVRNSGAERARLMREHLLASLDAGGGSGYKVRALDQSAVDLSTVRASR